jgi:hypothetical protein
VGRVGDGEVRGGGGGGGGERVAGVGDARHGSAAWGRAARCRGERGPPAAARRRRRPARVRIGLGMIPCRKGLQLSMY